MTLAEEFNKNFGKYLTPINETYTEDAYLDINDSIVEELIEEIHAQKLITWDDEINTDKLEMRLKDVYLVRKR